MRRPSIVLAGIAIALLAILPLVAAPAAAAVTATGVPTSVAACRHGGWRTVSDPTGAPFGSRAACIRWATAHPGGALTLADLGGAFSGTESFTFECTFVRQIFTATYPSRGRVGTASLSIDGCVDGAIANYSGTFSISTPLGTVSGTAVGTLAAATSLVFHLVLDATAGTGAFAGLSGTLLADISWGGFPATAITGTITSPPAP